MRERDQDLRPPSRLPAPAPTPARPSGFWEVDLRTDELYLSTQAFEVLRPASVSLAGFVERVHVDDRLLIEHVTDRARVQPGPYRLVHRTADGDGARTLQHDMQSVVGDDGRPGRLLGFVSDVTAEHALDEQMRRIAAQQSVGLVAGGIVHDLNNTFAVINGHVELAVQAHRRGAPIDVIHLEAIARAADSARALTRSLLATGREGPLVPRRVRPAEILDRVLDAAQATLGVHRTVELRGDGNDIELVADPERLERTLIDLVVNADDALPDGSGHVEIGCCRVLLDEHHPRVADGSLAPGVYAELTVVDDGCGMDEAVVSRIFEPYFTTKPPERGSGIGLASANRFALRSGGALSVASAVDEGTTVILLLPAIERPPAPRRSGPPPRRLLLVGGDGRAARIAGALSADGYQVVQATGPADAWTVIRTEPIDAVVADGPLAGELERAGLCRRSGAAAGTTEVLLPVGRGGPALAGSVAEVLRRLDG